MTKPIMIKNEGTNMVKISNIVFYLFSLFKKKEIQN